jgi:hypothetical protein
MLSLCKGKQPYTNSKLATAAWLAYRCSQHGSSAGNRVTLCLASHAVAAGRSGKEHSLHCIKSAPVHRLHCHRSCTALWLAARHASALVMPGANCAVAARRLRVARLGLCCTCPASRFDRKFGRDRVFLKASRDLDAYEEVFVSYGELQRQHSLPPKLLRWQTAVVCAVFSLHQKPTTVLQGRVRLAGEALV